MSENTPPETQCDINSVRKILDENPKLAMIYTRPGCGFCPDYLKTVKEGLKDKKDITLVEIEVGKDEYECELTADAFDVKRIPTLLYFKDGKLQKTLRPSGDVNKDRITIDDIEIANQNMEDGGTGPGGAAPS